MGKRVKEIWIESEHSSPILGGETELNDNSDVIVTFSDHSRAVATFFTYQNIEFLRQKNKHTGECLNGKYFWASDMILVDRINRQEIEELVNHLLEEDQFDWVFTTIKD